MLVLLLSLVAQAPAADPTEIPWWGQLLITAGSAFGSLLLALGARYLGKLTSYLAEKTKLGFIANVDEVLMGVVTDLYNTQVEHWKAAAKDGKLTDQEKAQAKALALAWAKRLLDWEHVEAVFGKADAEDALKQRIELAVTKAQLAGSAAGKKGPRKDP
jgi:hypothetical protein